MDFNFHSKSNVLPQSPIAFSKIHQEYAYLANKATTLKELTA